MTTERKPMELVQLVSGERLEAGKTTDQGVLTDAGLSLWDEIAGFWVWASAIGHRVFIPVDHREEQDRG